VKSYRLAAAILAFVICVGAVQAQTAPPAKPASPAQAPAPAAKAAAAPGASQEEKIPPAAPDALFPAVVARVNGRAILGRDLEQLIRTELASIGSPEWANLREDYRQDLASKHLGALIATELLFEKAASAGTKAAEADIQAEFDKVAKTYNSELEMDGALSKRGIDRATLKKEIEQNLVVSKFVQETIINKIAVTPAEVSDYYGAHKDEFQHPDLVRTSHILIAVPDNATNAQENAARKRADDLLARAKKGEDFAKLAKENSSDSSSAQGGDIGYIESGETAPEYQAVAFGLPVGGIDLARTAFGWHVIKVTDIKKAGVSTLEESRNQLTDFLKTQKTQDEVAKAVDEMRAKSKVELLLPPGLLPVGAPQSSPQ
jgi:parvulin-like peptidyl-prolyl isomerase